MRARRLDDPALPGAINMARDDALLERRVCPTLRFYRWAKPTLSLGYFQAASDLPLAALRAQGIDIVRRATGGKAILHDRELTYSICAPEEGALGGGPARAMQELHAALAEVLGQQLNEDIVPRNDLELLSDRPGSAWCFEDSSPLDLVRGQRKLVGSAARRRQGWILFHGSLVIEAPPQTPGIGAIGSEPDRDAIAEVLGHSLGHRFRPDTWHNEELESAENAEAHFSADAHVFRR